jgi:hypothetical protein
MKEGERKERRTHTQTKPITGPLTTFSSPSVSSSAIGTANTLPTISLVAFGPSRSTSTSSVSLVNLVAPSGSADDGA